MNVYKKSKNIHTYSTCKNIQNKIFILEDKIILYLSFIFLNYICKILTYINIHNLMIKICYHFFVLKISNILLFFIF